MNTKISVASLKPSFRMVIQLTALDGIWSRKISQSAIPRNRSSRRSRSVGTGAMFGFSFLYAFGHNPGRPANGKARRSKIVQQVDVSRRDPQDRSDRDAPFSFGAVVTKRWIFFL